MPRSKRARLDIDYRARSPKRRKCGTTTASTGSESPSTAPSSDSIDPRTGRTYSTRQITLGEQLTLPERFHLGKDVWPASRILQEKRGRDNKIVYLVEWEPHPLTDETWKPTWEPRTGVGHGLVETWEEQQRSQRQSDHTYQPSQAPPLQPSPTGSQPSARSIRRTRTARLRPIITDSSSDIVEPGSVPTSASHTPSLFRESGSSAEDDLGPDSPSLEISETQIQSSHSATDSVPNFTLEIPINPFRGSIEAKSSSEHTQTSASKSLPESAADDRSVAVPDLSSTTTSERCARTQVHSQPLVVIQDLDHPLSDTLDVSLHHIQIPESSERAEIQASIEQSSAPVVHESSVENKAERTTHGESQEIGSQQRSQKPSANSPRFSTLSGLEEISPLPSQSIAAKQSQLLPAFDPELRKSSRQSSLDQQSSAQTSSPWQFESQLPEVRQAVISPTTKSRRQEEARKHFGTKSPNAMDAPPLRQSPRLQAATPVSRTRSPQRASQLRRARTPQSFADVINSDAVSANAVTSPLATAPPHVADYTEPSPLQMLTPKDDIDSALSDPHYYDPTFVSALPIQQSIEEEPQSSTDSIASKASSSQVSLLNERVIPQIDGVSLPAHAVIGPGEYLVGLPAEGKVQSVYIDHINAKRKAIVKFIHRRGSVGSANGSTNRTLERNQMIELMELLQDTTTHMDLGLPGFTQYSIRSEEETAYAEYAGSKFVLLGELVKMLKRVDCTLVIACKQGAVQDLLADYLAMRQVQVRRHDRPPSARAGTPETLRDTLKVDIISTTADSDMNLSAPPALIIAFDASFDSQAPHVKRIRELYSRGRDQPLAVVHLLVTNSAEHVDRCLRKAMPSPQRLKLLVRGTYLARSNLGGSPTYIPHPNDEPQDRPMGMGDLQRAVRKSPNRKLQMMAAIIARASLSPDFEEHWSLSPMPEVQYDELEDTPPKISENTTAAGTAAPTPRDGRMRTRSPASRSATPMGRKRMLDVDAASSILYKRQRLTPMRDITPTNDVSQDHTRLDALHEQIKAMTIELTTEKQARLEAEEVRDGLREELSSTTDTLKQWQNDHADLQRRYERQRKINRDVYKENKITLKKVEASDTKSERLRETNTKLRTENTQHKKDLTDARADLMNSGGDVTALETARAKARTAQDRAGTLERQLENAKRDFEFTRELYQQGSGRASELVAEVSKLEEENTKLQVLASDERRRLKELNILERAKVDTSELARVREENRGLELVLKKMEAENNVLKKGRGVQTRGSSAQPPNSPGLGGFFPGGVGNRRSRQASPAVPNRVIANLAVPTV